MFIKGGIGYSQWFYLGQKETNKYLKANGFGFTLGPGFQIFHFLGIEADFYYARTVNNRTVHEYSYVGMIPQLTNTIEYKEIYRIVCFRFTVKLDLL